MGNVWWKRAPAVDVNEERISDDELRTCAASWLATAIDSDDGVLDPQRIHALTVHIARVLPDAPQLPTLVGFDFVAASRRLNKAIELARARGAGTDELFYVVTTSPWWALYAVAAACVHNEARVPWYVDRGAVPESVRRLRTGIVIDSSAIIILMVSGENVIDGEAAQ